MASATFGSLNEVGEQKAAGSEASKWDEICCYCLIHSSSLVLYFLATSTLFVGMFLVVDDDDDDDGQEE